MNDFKQRSDIDKFEEFIFNKFLPAMKIYANTDSKQASADAILLIESTYYATEHRLTTVTKETIRKNIDGLGNNTIGKDYVREWLRLVFKPMMADRKLADKLKRTSED